MLSREQTRNMKILLVLIFIVAVTGAALYIIYGLAIIWQTFAATIIIGFLSIILLLLTILSIYLWTRNLIFKRDLRKCQEELNRTKEELKQYKNNKP